MKANIKWEFSKCKKLWRGPRYNTASGEQDSGFKQQSLDREKRVIQVRYYYENDTPANPTEIPDLPTGQMREKVGLFNIGKEIRSQIKRRNIDEIKTLLENFDKSKLSQSNLSEMMVAASEGNI